MNLSVLLWLVAIFLALAAVWGFLGRLGDETPEQIKAWERAMGEEGSAVGRILTSMARPVSRLDAMQGILPSRQYRFLRSRLIAADKFGSDVDIFISVQVVALFIAAGLVVLALFSKGILVFGLGALALGIAGWPWNVVSKAAKKRADEVTDSLPEFAELLQMVIASGAMGLEAAMGFTADRVEGPVSDEVRNMLTIIRNNPSEEVAAYTLAGERLGTPEARTFFASILQAQIDGAKILENLASQSRGLRQAAYQKQRAEIKKLPVKLVVMFGVHLFPLLFVVSLLPAFYSVAHI